MLSINKHRAASRKQLRSFGLILAGGFLVIGLSPIVLHRKDPPVWALVITVTSGFAALVVPSLLRSPYLVWMFLGECLGWVNSRIILGGLFYGLVTPMRLIMAITGHDPMNRKFDKHCDTYRINRHPRRAGHMTHPF